MTVETISVGPETVEVASFSEVRPRWSAELRAAVSGRINKVFDTALAGERVEAGATLITIENSRYVAELAAAELALKEAKLALWKAKNATTLARKEFERNNTTPPNDLALRLPELEIAQSRVTSVKSRVEAARRQLDDSTVTAPFSSFVAERFVSPGQSVNAGETLVKLVDDTTFELTVELGRRDWVLLQQPLPGQTAHVVSQDGETIAQATIRQAGGFLDEKTRQYKVFLEIDDPGPVPVLSGDFVRVILPGVTVPKALNIPASALTQEGYVWYLDENDRLQRVTPQVLYRRQDRIVIEAPEGADTWRIAVTPLVSFLPGQMARAKKAGI
ncbi:efflux RND transporter periplasmic adaptor subunit [Hoeflea sp. TYP-13]|uniref:efflux RND transporter periplasmic adaptor subunit n=1 Tax=Hoeflea sp. TYP-13 TaxID=3230023 RepID=UPI0034C5D91B